MDIARTKLSVNINKVALIRNSRGGNRPDLVQVARDCEDFGADGITVHPRPDERHVRYDDLLPLKNANRTEFNIEGYPSDTFMKHVLTTKPDQCTLVPDPPGVLTSNCGWAIAENASLLRDVIATLKNAGIRTSLFIDPKESSVAEAAKVGSDRVEIYTGKFAADYVRDPHMAVAAHVSCANQAKVLGIGLNAGHDLDLDNLQWYSRMVPGLLEVSIGHALISDALYFGLENIIPMYKRKLSHISY